MFDHWRGKFDATRKVLKKKAKISKKGSAKTTAKAKQSVRFSNQRNEIEVDIEDDLNEDLEDTESDLEKLEEDQDDRIPQYKSPSNRRNSYKTRPRRNNRASRVEKRTKKPARQAGGRAPVGSRQRPRAKSKDLSPVPEPCDYFYDGEPEAPHANLIMRPTGGRSEDRKEKFKENNYPFNIHPDHWKQIGRDMYASATTYPAIFGDSIHSIYDYCHEFKAADW